VTIGLLPIVTGDIVAAHFLPLLPITDDADAFPRAGSWRIGGVHHSPLGKVLTVQE
jgi:hypothetical protein